MATASETLQSGNILGAFGLDKFNFGLGTIGTILLWILISFLVLGVICGIIIWIYYRKTYNQKAVVYGLVGNVPQEKYEDKARYVRMGTAGDRLFYLKSAKKWLPPPTIQAGKNKWYFWEREDGELINVSLQNLDKEMKKLGFYFVDSDMRMQRLGIEKNLRDRFDKGSWWSKYGATVMGVIFVVLVTVALVVLFAKLVDVSESLDKTSQSVGKLAENVAEYYKIKSGELPDGSNSGLVPVSAVLPLIEQWLL